MKDVSNSPLVPVNVQGKAIDLESSIVEGSKEEAVNTFNRACKRILNPPVWKELAGNLSASFTLTSPDGIEVNRLAQTNDYLQIDIPGPGPTAGNGYDWVKVESISENADPASEESICITLKSASDPGKTEEEIAHFFGDGASSTFIIKRNGNTVIASYHGRNELPNDREPSFRDRVRNTIIAAGALAGISELQWTALIKGLLQKEIGG